MMTKRTNAERCREQWAKHRDKRVAQKREHYAENRERMRAANKARYARDRDKNLGYANARRGKRPNLFGEWASGNPERAVFHRAKLLIWKATGLRVSDIPDELAWARVELLKIRQWIRAAQGIDARQRQDAERLDPKGESPVRDSECAKEQPHD